MTSRQVSAIICAHDQAGSMPAVVGQIRAHDYPGDASELRVVDNGWADRTPQVVERLVEEPGIPVRCVSEPQPGIGVARTRGAAEARHPSVVNLEDACRVRLDWLRRAVRQWALRPGLGPTVGNVFVGGRSL